LDGDLLVRFNTIFLLKATVVAALACLPMAFHEHGYVATMFLVPASFTCFAASRVERHGEFELKFKKLPNYVVEILTSGGRQSQRVIQNRVGGAGFTLATGLGIVGLCAARQLPFADLLPIIMLCFTIPLAVWVTPYRTVRTKERQFVTEYLWFERWRLSRRRWQVCEGDSLTIFTVNIDEEGAKPEFPYQHMLCVCRGRRRQVIAVGDFTRDRAVPGMENVARRIAKLVGLPYSGYRKSKGFWWTRGA
jgi:hypothetical protein